MSDELKRCPAVFFRTRAGGEPVREWLQGLKKEDRKRIGEDIKTAEYGWLIGMPLCRPMGGGLWEVRVSLDENRIARILFCIVDEHLVLLHGFIKKTPKTPVHELKLAQQRMKEVKQ